MTADLILKNGNFITFNKKQNYTWLAISKGKIVDAGYEDMKNKYLGKCDDIIDLEGKTVLPGFYDSHVQLVQAALKSVSLDLISSKSFQDVEDKITDWMKKNPKQDTLIAFGLEMGVLDEKRLPTRKVLDKYTANQSVIICTRDFQFSILNTRAMHDFSIPLVFSGVDFDEEGKPNGIIHEQVNAIIRKKIFQSYTEQEKINAINEYVEDVIIKKGVTTINAMEGGYGFCDSNAELVYKLQQNLPIDIILYYNTTDISKALNLNLTRVGGDVFIDGSFTSYSAAIENNYEGTNNNGELYFMQEELNQYILEAYRNDLQISVHAVGERALEQALIAHEYAQAIYPNKEMRNRVEHAEISSKEQRIRAKKLGLIFSMQPAYEYFYNTPGGMYEQRLGTRNEATNVLRDIIDDGIMICGGSDNDLTPIDPILGIYMAVNHCIEKKRISVIEAIKMFTINSAYAVNEEKTKGSIEINKNADLIVLDKNILEVDMQSIKEIKIICTIKDGNIIYKAVE